MLHTHARYSLLCWGVAIGLGLFLWLCMTPVAFAADITVNTTADNTIPGDGFCTLREAVNNANANADTTSGDCPAGDYLPTDRIYLPAGRYRLHTGFDDTNQHGDLDVLSAGGSLRLIGADAGTTTIQGPGYVVGTDRLLHLGVDGPAAVEVDIVNLTLRDGHAPQGGGAIYANGVSVLVDHSLIAENEAIFAGGMTNNGNGGGIYMNGGSLTILNSELFSNTARTGVVHDVQGGAIHATNGATVLIEDSVLRENRTRVTDTGSGRTSAGAIFFDGTELTIRASKLVSNSVAAIFSTGKGFGGAIYFNGARLVIEESTLAGNTAGEAAGALYHSGGQCEIVRSTFSGNQVSEGYGGAIINTSLMTITNSTLSGNVALMTAGGLSNGFSGQLMLRHTTIADNTCATAGGFMGGGCGVHHWGMAVLVQNSILAGNRDLGSGRPLSPDAAGTFTSLGHNLVGDGSSAGGFVDGVNGDQVGSSAVPLNARLLPLGRYGGFTLTHLQVWGSPTIGAIPAALCLPIDQRGVNRLLDADCDIGAVEYDGAPCFLPVVVK